MSGSFWHCVSMTRKDDGTTVPLNGIPCLHRMLWVRALAGHASQHFHSETEGKREVTGECEEAVLIAHLQKKDLQGLVPSTAALMDCTTGSNPLVLVLDTGTYWLCRYPYPILTLWIQKRVHRGGKVEVERVLTSVLLWASGPPRIPQSSPCLSPHPSSTFWWEARVPLCSHPRKRASLAGC